MVEAHEAVSPRHNPVVAMLQDLAMLSEAMSAMGSGRSCVFTEEVLVKKRPGVQLWTKTMTELFYIKPYPEQRL